MSNVRHAILCGMIAPQYEFDGERPPDTELWGVNRTHLIQKDPPLDRVYFFDSLGHFVNGGAPDAVKEWNELGVPIYTRHHYPELPTSVQYPIDKVIAHFDLCYFTCTVSYMIAHAIYEGVEQITLTGMYHLTDSSEYMSHKACVEYWVGVAVGQGLDVTINGNTMLCRPFPWQAAKYGYTAQLNEMLAIKTMQAAYMACVNYPISFKKADLIADDEIGKNFIEPGDAVSMLPTTSGEMDRMNQIADVRKNGEVQDLANLNEDEVKELVGKE
jgi:hypothetical protein